MAQKLVGAKDGLGARIEGLREERGISQEELAEKLKVSRSKINMWERGERDLKSQDIVALSETFNVSSDYLLGIIGDVKTQDIEIKALNQKYGLSEAALSVLEEMRAYKCNDFVLRAVNALLENGVTLGAIAQYLYFNLSEDYRQKGIVPFVTVYKYGKKGDNSIWGDDAKKIGLYSTVEAMTNDTYKRTLMLRVQEKLQKMLDKEDETV